MIRFQVTGHVAGTGQITHMISAANDDLAKGRFRRVYAGRPVEIIDCKCPRQVEAAQLKELARMKALAEAKKEVKNAA